jgi:hypothetical protein
MWNNKLPQVANLGNFDHPGLNPTARSGQIPKHPEKWLILTIFDQKRVLDHLFDP